MILWNSLSIIQISLTVGEYTFRASDLFVVPHVINKAISWLSESLFDYVICKVDEKVDEKVDKDTR